MSEKELSFNIKLCDNIFSQGSGLMFRFPKKPFAYIFPFKIPARHAITMWCVFYPIDLLFLDSNGLIIEIVKNLKPFRNYFPKNKFSTLIEIPDGYIEKYGFSIGQKMSWSKNSLILR